MKQSYHFLFIFFLVCFTSKLYSQSVPSYVPTNGLVGWWGFNGNAQDGSGNGNHGTIVGSITNTTDRFGIANSALFFNGNDCHIPLPTLNTLPYRPISYSAWVIVNSYFPITFGHKFRAIAGRNTAFVGDCGVIGFWSDGGYPSSQQNTFLLWRGGGSTGSPPLAATSPQLNQWVHVVYTQEINGDWKWYMNGALSNSGNFTDPMNYFSEFRIGGCNNYNCSWNDKLDDIGIWNRSLTPQEITNLYLSQSGVSVPQVNSCVNDTVSVAIANPALNGVANAALRMSYNADSLTYVGSSNLNPAFNGMVVNGGNGVVTLDWNTSTNQNIQAGNMVNLRFRVNGSSALTWDTLVYPSEFSDVNFNVVPQTFQSGGVTNRTVRYHEQRQICQGQTLQMGGQTLSTGGNYQVVLPGSGTDCDTLVNLTLSVLPTQTSISATTCSNQPYSFDGQNLNVTGVYRDTLINVLGCDSVVTLNLTVRPAYSQTISVVNCPGTSYNFGSQVLTTSGTYTNTFSTVGGCDSVVQLNLTFADSIQIMAQGGLNGFCPGGTLRIGTLSNFQQGTYQWKLNGNIIGTANADTLLVNQAGTYQAELVLTPTCTLYSNILTVSVLNCNQITGNLRYDNANLTPLAGVPVELKTLLGNVVAADTTDSSGNYSMSGYANGNYILDARIGYNSGGINSTDALLVNRYFTSLISLTPLRARAGDVNGNQITNSGDALLISRRITNLLSSFAVGNYVNDKPTINAQGNPLSVSMRALSTGDVNGSFIVQPSAPILVLDTVYGNGSVGSAVVRFTNPGSGVFERGIVWSSSPNPTISSNKSVAGKGGFGFTQSFGGVTVGSQYYVRAYARTSAGVYYSPERSFTSAPGLRCPGTPTVTDIDGNLYQTVQIGTQCWTQSNLKVSKYRNGDNIPTGLNNSAWGSTIDGAFDIYDNNPVNDLLYGKLYNHYAVMDTRGLCPTGWHVSTDDEWNLLVKYLDPSADTMCLGCWQSSVAGGMLKSMATHPIPGGWPSPNTGALTSTGFEAVPGGRRFIDGNFLEVDTRNFYWTSTLSGNTTAGGRIINYDYGGIDRWGGHPRWSGYSVRCLKDIVPTVSTSSVSNVTTTSATTGGDVTQDGGSPVTARGVAYGTSSSPTTAGAITNDGIGTGVFTSTLTGLTPSTTYYVRAYATNSVGTAYGNEVSFTTSPLAIGMSYAGGIIFYLDSTGQHGMVCAPINQVDFIYWGNPLGVVGWGCQGGNVLINNGTEFGTSQLLGTGFQNTTNILNSCPYRPIAASFCDELVLNGYSDWYLPSLDELFLMYNLKVQGIGNFNNHRYWSSSQHNQSLSVSSYYQFNRYAYAVDFSNGNYSVFEKSNQPSLTRAIRNF